MKKIKINDPNYNCSKEKKEKIAERSKRYEKYIRRTQRISKKSLGRRLSNQNF